MLLVGSGPYEYFNASLIKIYAPLGEREKESLEEFNQYFWTDWYSHNKAEDCYLTMPF